MEGLKTRWSDSVTPDHVWMEYPRPSLVRSGWMSLNGLWEYKFTDDENRPVAFEGQILVPFSPEAPLSGVNRQLMPEERLWYRSFFSAGDMLRKYDAGRLLLHFGAVDQSCTVYVNGKEAGSHVGGYLPFTLDITDFCSREAENELLLKVKDVSDTSWHSRGKQKIDCGGMFYTAQSGIWQPVWLESVPEDSVRYVRIRTDYEEGRVKIKVGTRKTVPVQITVLTPFSDAFVTEFSEHGVLPEGEWEEEKVRIRASGNREWTIDLMDFESWTPEHPFLYGVLIKTEQDSVLSYFAMRKCEVKKDENGISRIFLNGRPYFQTGVLDQGYWPDGLYTAPCDQAFVHDIELAKDMGFRMMRKHVKIEQERWYYHCDRLGMLVWQDMVNGGSSYRQWFVTYLATAFSYLHISVKDRWRRLLSRREKEGCAEFRREVRETVKVLYNHPCIVCWVPFNEGWGQFDAEGITEEIRSLDGSRIIDQASGWYDQGGGDIKSIHSYFLPFLFRKEKRAAALTEFGGYSLQADGYRLGGKAYGYKQFESEEELKNGLERLMEKTVIPSVKKGVSATVYTQLSDIEDEINGLITYDRETEKVDKNWMKVLNERIIRQGELNGIPESTGRKKTAFTEKKSAAVSIIGGSDGPTAVFLAGKSRHKGKERERWEKQLELLCRDTDPGTHTVEELEKYLIEKYGAEKQNPNSRSYEMARRCMWGNLVLCECPELVKTPMPAPLGRHPGKAELEAYIGQMEKRNREAEQVPSSALPMRYERYRIPLKEDGKVYGELNVETEAVRQHMSVSFSAESKWEEANKAAADIYRYFGVSAEDMEKRSERFLAYAAAMDMKRHL